jgi:hypothetical protein
MSEAFASNAVEVRGVTKPGVKCRLFVETTLGLVVRGNKTSTIPADTERSPVCGGPQK